MKLENLQTFKERALAFDTETHLIQPGLLAPPMVCGSMARGSEARLLDKEDCRYQFIQALESDAILVGANIAYDMLVMAVDLARNKGVDAMPLIFKAYREERVWDVLIAEQLNAIANDCLGFHPETRSPVYYTLDDCVNIRLGRDNAKANDIWRKRYAELDGQPIDTWPEQARTYPVDDAVNTLELALAQIPSPEGMQPPQANGPIPSPHNPHKGIRNAWDMTRQVRYAWAAHLGAAWGFKRDLEAVAELEARVKDGRRKDLMFFVGEGLLRAEAIHDYKRKEKKAFLKALSLVHLAGGHWEGGYDYKAETPKIKKLVAEAFGAVDACPDCGGVGKVTSPKTGKPIGCATCDRSGLDLAGVPFIPTPGGGVSASRDALYETGSEYLARYAYFNETAKVETTYLPWLWKGAEDGKNPPLNLKPRTLLKSGRASYGDVVQQLPRSLGVRETLVARPGFVLVSCDYEGGELVTHGQNCLDWVGWSKMAEAINNGMKLHDLLGSEIAGIEYEEFLARKGEDKFLADCRQSAKPVNFGCPGLLGAVTLVIQQRQQGPDTTGPDGTTYKGLRFCLLTGGQEKCGVEKITEWKGRPCSPVCRHCVETAEKLRILWFNLFPENHEYFELIGKIADEERPEIMQPFSRRIRGESGICSLANTGFQGRLADITKDAAWLVADECYTDKSSPLYGSRSILFAHDEIVAEVREDKAAAAANRIATLMVDAAKVGCPDVTMKAEPCLMRRWYKGAKPAFNEKGELIPWEP